jgi:hypothetical protein
MLSELESISANQGSQCDRAIDGVCPSGSCVPKRSYRPTPFARRKGRYRFLLNATEGYGRFIQRCAQTRVAPRQRAISFAHICDTLDGVPSPLLERALAANFLETASRSPASSQREAATLLEGRLVILNTALGAARRMSHINASSKPPVMHQPLIAAIERHGPGG